MSEVVYQKSKALTATPLTYCPGCTHGIIHKLVAEVMEELNIISNTIGIASVGCSVMSYLFFNCDMVQAAHGRACAVATGIKRTSPEQVVFTYQGDGDLASIGIAETIHAANRGENITVIFINNAIYGMTRTNGTYNFTWSKLQPHLLVEIKVNTVHQSTLQIPQAAFRKSCCL